VTIQLKIQHYFVIYSQEESEHYKEATYWSNSNGWGSLSNATVFSGREARRYTKRMRLPSPGGEFVGLPLCLMLDPRWKEEDDDEA
jgi:hypothetical protein